MKILKKFLPHFKYTFKIFSRGIQHTDKTNSQFTDIKFDTCFGTIRGKLWGLTNKQPIVALHGFMDNAASFDLIAPLLKNSSVLAIDLPGHGLSSWLPKGIPYNSDHIMLTLRSMANHYGWNKIKLLGHSMGGILVFTYTQLFPEEIEFSINIDSLGIIPIKDDITYLTKKKESIIKFLQFEKKASNSRPRYSKEVAIKKWMDANKYSNYDSSTIEPLFNRGTLKQRDGKYCFARDYRLNFEEFFYNVQDQNVINRMAKTITSPYLVLRATKSPFNKDSYWSLTEVLKKSSKDFRLKHIEGCHHMHITNPQKIADEINPFLMEYDK